MHGSRRERGQTIVIFALALVAIVAMLGLVIDGGNAYAQQRKTQNGADAAAEAGATALARRLVGITGSDAQWDARVVTAVNDTATANEVVIVGTPQYTDRTGAVLGPIGTGVIPTNTQGVLVGAERQFNTYFSAAIGLGQFTATADATAITGYAETSGRGNLIPLALPINLTQCESGGGSTRIYHPFGGVEWPYGPNNIVALPLCSNGPGNVGWLDWTPTGGGASELGNSIRNPDNPPLSTPKWYYITAQGVVTSVDDDMDTWEGQEILIPIFHVETNPDGTPSLIGTCDDTPGGAQVNLSDCAPGDIGMSGAQGWYYLETFAEFHLIHSYIQGNFQTECNDPTLASTAGTGTGNQPNNCLIGYFTGPVVAGEFEVGGTTPPSTLTPVSIQLID